MRHLMIVFLTTMSGCASQQSSAPTMPLASYGYSYEKAQPSANPIIYDANRGSSLCHPYKSSSIAKINLANVYTNNQLSYGAEKMAAKHVENKTIKANPEIYLRKKYRQLTNEFEKQVESIVTAIAKEKNYDFVINEARMDKNIRGCFSNIVSIDHDVISAMNALKARSENITSDNQRQCHFIASAAWTNARLLKINSSKNIDENDLKVIPNKELSDTLLADVNAYKKGIYKTPEDLATYRFGECAKNKADIKKHAPEVVVACFKNQATVVDILRMRNTYKKDKALSDYTKSKNITNKQTKEKLKSLVNNIYTYVLPGESPEHFIRTSFDLCLAQPNQFPTFQ